MNPSELNRDARDDGHRPLGVAAQWIASGGRRIALHVSHRQAAGAELPPLLLIHSVNASPSVIEMRTPFQLQAQRRTVVALDLPGFGASDRLPGPYTPQLMVRAVLDTLAWMRQHVAPAPADVMALSLGCEFATLAALAEPGSMRSLALISPTGMERRRIGEAHQGGRTQEIRPVSAVLHWPGVGPALYAALTSRPSMRWFLGRSWGTRHFDPALLDAGHANARVRGAHHAALDFLSGALFTRGIVACYSRLALPVLVAHGQRGAFTDFEAYGHVAALAPGPWQRRIFATGAMPHLECGADFDAAYQSWLGNHVLPPRAQATLRFDTMRSAGAHDQAGPVAGHGPATLAGVR